MANIAYLLHNRVKFPVHSNQFYKVWAKRILSFPELLNRNFRRLRLINKGATIHRSAEIGKAKVDGNKKLLSVGESSFIGNINISLYAPLRIGNRVCINDGVKILTASHDVTDPYWKHVKAEIIIDDYAWIGIGAIILPGVKIGYGAVVGAGAVVSKSVLPRTVVVGNPARAISKMRCENLDYNPCEFLAANRSWLIG